MRTGAIFARGSCRALKWMALFGVVFALGAGSAAAQITVTVPDKVDEGADVNLTVGGSISIPAGTAVGILTITGGTLAAGTATATARAATDANLGFIGQVQIDTPAHPASATSALVYAIPAGHALVWNVGRDGAGNAEDEVVNVPEFTVAHSVLTLGSPANAAEGKEAVIIEDATPQDYTLSLPDGKSAIMEGDPMATSLTLKANPPKTLPVAGVMFELSTNSAAYALTMPDGTPLDANGRALTGGGMLDVGLKVGNDGNRKDESVTVTAKTATMTLKAQPIAVTDAHKLPMLRGDLWDSDSMEVTGPAMEGADYKLRVFPVDADGDRIPATEDWTVTLTTGGTATEGASADYTLADSVEIAMNTVANMSHNTAALMVMDDNDLDPNETVVVSYTVMGDPANGPGMSDSMELLTVTIEDETMAQVRAKSDAEAQAVIDAALPQADPHGFNPGDSITFDPAKMFTPTEGYELGYEVSSGNTATARAGASDGMVRVDAVAVGSTTLTVTARARMASAVPQTQAGVAQVMVNVAVVPQPDAPVDPVAPSAPQNLTATAGNAQVVLSWTAPASGDAPTGYEYHAAGAGITSSWTSTSSTATTHTVTGLTNGTEYTFQVRAMNAGGTGLASASVKATPMAPDPGVQVTVKSVTTSTSVDESGGLEVSVVANVPAGTKVDGKVAPIPSRILTVSFLTPATNEAAEVSGRTPDVYVLPGSSLVWNKIPRTEKASTATFKFRLGTGSDADAEDEKFQVEVSIDGASKTSKMITIDDTETQTYALSLPDAAKGKIKEGGSETLTVKAEPKRTFDIPVTLALNPNDPSKYTLGATSGTFGPGTFSTTVSAKADGDRDDDTVTVTAYTSGTLGNDVKIAELDITITDANKLPTVKAAFVDSKGAALSPQPTSAAEGDTVKIMLTVVDDKGKAMKAAEKLTISLMPTSGDGQDYRLSTHPIEIAKDKESSAAVDLMLTKDDDYGAETLTFEAVVSGESKNGSQKKSVAGVLSLMIEDGTQKLVWANSQDAVEAAVYAAKNAGAGADKTLTEGEMIEVMGAALFSSAEGVSVSYTAESSMSGVASTSVSGGSVMVTAKSEGTADITITAHANMASGVKIVDQTDPGMASIMFPVEVGLEALSITLEGPEDMNLAEGMSARVTATANRAVTAETTVMLMRDRAMSSASDADYEAEAITIAAGETMGSTMVMAVEDNMAEDMEELVLYGMTEGMAGEVTGNVKLYLWDAAVPALPVIAQLLLAAFLAVGGYRRYRRQ